MDKDLKMNTETKGSGFDENLKQLIKVEENSAAVTFSHVTSSCDKCLNENSLDLQFDKKYGKEHLIKKRKRRSVSFAATARMRCDSCSGEVELNASFNEGKNNNPTSKNIDSAKQTENILDMQMTVGLSIIQKENGISANSSPCDVKKICHSTPLMKYENVFNGPRENHDLFTEEKCAKQDQVVISSNVTVNNLKKISIDTKSRECLNSRKEDENNFIVTELETSRKGGNNNANTGFSEMKPVHNSNKNVQVSKMMLCSSTSVQGTVSTVSRKKSGDLSTSYSYQGENNNTTRSKKENDLVSLTFKRSNELNYSIKSRSYHSDLVSTLETDSSRYSVKKSLKKVLFKHHSTEEDITTTDYRSSTSGSSYYITRNTKSVGFREAISLIDRSFIDHETENTNSQSDTSTNENLVDNHRYNSETGTRSNDVVFFEGNEVSLVDAEQVPEIILTVNGIKENNMSKECSLYTKLIQTASKYKKRGKRKSMKRQTIIKPLNGCRNNFKINPESFNNCYKTPQTVRNWISPKLIVFLNKKLMNDNLNFIINTERVVSVLCSVVDGVKNLKNGCDIASTVLPLMNVLLNFNICSNMIEYCSFIMRFTPFRFQKKALPLGGCFGSMNLISKKKLTNPILTKIDKDKYDSVNQLYMLEY